MPKHYNTNNDLFATSDQKPQEKIKLDTMLYQVWNWYKFGKLPRTYKTSINLYMYLTTAHHKTWRSCWTLIQMWNFVDSPQNSLILVHSPSASRRPTACYCSWKCNYSWRQKQFFGLQLTTNAIWNSSSLALHVCLIGATMFLLHLRPWKHTHVPA